MAAFTIGNMCNREHINYPSHVSGGEVQYGGPRDSPQLRRACLRVHAEATINFVASCTERKRATIPPDLRLRSVDAGPMARRVEQWWERLGQQAPRYIARDLYAGEHWSVVQDALALLGDASLWVASAGYGLIAASANVLPYSATFAQGTPDSVTSGPTPGQSRVDLLQAWWSALCDLPGPQKGVPRSLGALARSAPNAPLLIVGSPDYIRAMRLDLLAARDALATPHLLTVISNHDLGSDAALAPHLIPVDERCRTLLGGTMQGLNARVARSLLEWGRSGPLTAPRLRERYDSMVSDAEKPPKFNRDRMDDKDVLAFLRGALTEDPRAGWTLLLRTLRANGRACEQGRFRELHRQVREDLAQTPQQGLKLGQD